MLRDTRGRFSCVAADFNENEVIAWDIAWS